MQSSSSNSWSISRLDEHKRLFHDRHIAQPRHIFEDGRVLGGRWPTRPDDAFGGDELPSSVTEASTKPTIGSCSLTAQSSRIASRSRRTCGPTMMASSFACAASRNALFVASINSAGLSLLASTKLRSDAIVLLEPGTFHPRYRRARVGVSITTSSKESEDVFASSAKLATTPSLCSSAGPGGRMITIRRTISWPS